MVVWKELWWNKRHGNLCWITGNVHESWRTSLKGTYFTAGYPYKTEGSGESVKDVPLTKGLLYW